ncbi:MAG: CarD family transcriptional regulator [Spirochaetaceae bacterium]|nr:CarD family transcriptional regulator [Spirochaetaceae bacterium]
MSEINFKVGQKIVYPMQGVGLVKAIEERLFKGKLMPYYNIYLESLDMTNLIPIDKAAELGIRPIVPVEEAEKALKIISEDFEPLSGDWKARYQVNHDLLKQGNVIDIATVVRALYHRSKIKELPILERKLYDDALKLLIDEISYSLGKKKSEVEEIIFSKLEPAEILLNDDWQNEDDFDDEE